MANAQNNIDPFHMNSLKFEQGSRDHFSPEFFASKYQPFEVGISLYIFYYKRITELHTHDTQDSVSDNVGMPTL